jgi:hypothetical protein
MPYFFVVNPIPDSINQLASVLTESNVRAK